MVIGLDNTVQLLVLVTSTVIPVPVTTPITSTQVAVVLAGPKLAPLRKNSQRTHIWQ